MNGRPIRSMGELRGVTESLQRLPEVEARIAVRVAETFSGLARASFDSQTSPGGRAWGKGAEGQPITLDKSGKLRAAATSYESIGTRVRVSVAAVRYGKYQLRFGIIPKTGDPLPEAWAEAVRQIAREELACHFGGTP